MSGKKKLYKLALRDVTLSKVYNQYVITKTNNPFIKNSDNQSLIEMIKNHIFRLNKALQKDKNNSNAYVYLSERILYWSNILVHKFDIYVDFFIPSPESLFGE